MQIISHQYSKARLPNLERLEIVLGTYTCLTCWVNYKLRPVDTGDFAAILAAIFAAISWRFQVDFKSPV